MSNESFETGNLTGWGSEGWATAKWGATFSIPSRDEGGWVLKLDVIDSEGSRAAVYQSLGASAGQEWSFSGYLYNSSGTYPVMNNVGSLKMIFQGSYGEQVFSADYSDPTQSTQDQWISRSVSGVAPEGTTAVKFQVDLSRVDVGGTLFWDNLDAQLSPVPEVNPGYIVVGMALLMVGTQRLATYRRIRKIATK